jgi:lipid-binding SYLF domain-containing protein
MNKSMATMVFIAGAILIAGCTTTGYRPGNAHHKANARHLASPAAAATVASFKNKDPSLARFFKDAYGYAIFPTVSKGGIVIGGAYGSGTVYARHRLVGSSSLTQFSIGAQLGGQTYSEIIFFRDKATLQEFEAGNFEISAQASAVAATKGAAASSDYNDGVAVFTMTKGGLMFEASIGGQQFTFKPLSKQRRTANIAGR